ncbi:MAG TPA: NADH-quinone oxidoreductase subunit L [Gemmatimonadales bacterium]|nr:NADH-quinone oxidoreductase subunit L [Gemmatimonadales bacterium]
MTAAALAAVLAQGVPLAVCAVVLVALRGRPRAAAALAIAGMAVSLAASAWLVATVAVPGRTLLAQTVFLPVDASRSLAFGVLLDPLSTTMALVVAAVTLAVMVYSTGYMAGDPGFGRYYGFLALFGWAMQGLVLSANLLQTLVFWELVGLASFLLIGFWFDRPAPAAAARKAFLMTRVGDVGFLLGVLLLIRALGLATIPDVIAAAAPGGALSPREVAVAAALLLMGVIGKSAQGPLFTWLPDAMEGPTPVSALLHSATMVAAGVYLVARLHPLFAAAPAVMHVLLWLALATALATATMAMVAVDIKRVLAYSTISQLAYMLMGLAAGSAAAGYFHLVTHAGFKALLFLTAGIFIHHAHSNDMREIAAREPRSQRAGVIGLVAGSAALAGVIPFAGYFSKEEILAAVGAGAPRAVLVLAYLGAGLTAYYAFRMVFLTLMPAGPGGGARTPGGAAAPHGGAAAPAQGRAPGELAMSVTVLVLAALTLVLGYLGPWLAARLGPGEAVRGPFVLGTGALVALALVAAGIGLAWLEFGRPGAPRIGFVERVPPLARFFGDNWYLDRLYRATVIRWATALSRAAHWNDRTLVDGATDGVANGTIGGGRLLALVQSGYVQVYLAVAVGLVAALAWALGAAGGGR